MDWTRKLKTKCLKLINANKEEPTPEDLIPLVEILPRQPKPKPEARIAGNSRLPRSGGPRSRPGPPKKGHRRYKFGDLEKRETTDEDEGQNQEEEEEDDGHEAEMDAISIVHMLDDEVPGKGSAAE
ncbi:uncharacterized protein LAJ45_00777 [Morchella importuna]|uniref:Uncharacterized protein n=1 Tax=Morchella conica CCBAS932 TaxID=1392247 RepID=A0A3N4KWR5_9PEZI|nr:uncharacterized protein LAJ45_00777 [Morchella importuna]KAH8155767.1 hypothetical protein LAJ45_00777 [Morchella importuna]RPB10235.1 hypothetical protein P167DRAFT_547331 [Morchella conica CCBAS932]